MEHHGRELCGGERSLRQFPLLVKFLDARDRLSLQVHPNDVQARFFDSRENGKTEAWVILDAQPDSRIYAGLKRGVDLFRLQQHLAAGTVENCLHSYPAHAGDCIFIPAGTVHAIGEGILLAEVQQSSDLTFRLHDWGRLGTDGQPRPLHIEESLACIDFDRGPVDPMVPRPIRHTTCEELVSSEFFVLRRHTLRGSSLLETNDRFHVLVVLSGNGLLACDQTEHRLSVGTTLLIPASSSQCRIVAHSELKLLDAFLPPVLAESQPENRTAPVHGQIIAPTTPGVAAARPT
jgi:mannose-6-phosphate isomerase